MTSPLKSMTYDYNSDNINEKIQSLKYDARKLTRLLKVAIINVNLPESGVVNGTTCLLFTPPQDTKVHGIILESDNFYALISIGVEGGSPSSIYSGDASPFSPPYTNACYVSSNGRPIYLTVNSQAGGPFSGLRIAIFYSNNT